MLVIRTVPALDGGPVKRETISSAGGGIGRFFGHRAMYERPFTETINGLRALLFNFCNMPKTTFLTDCDPHIRPDGVTLQF